MKLNLIEKMLFPLRLQILRIISGPRKVCMRERITGIVKFREGENFTVRYVRDNGEVDFHHYTVDQFIQKAIPDVGDQIDLDVTAKITKRKNFLKQSHPLSKAEREILNSRAAYFETGDITI